MDYGMERKISKQPIGIYIHVPFCVRKCYYCDFLSAPVDERTKEQYVQAVKEEIYSYQENLKAYQIQTIYFGGGTPSLLTAAQLQEILFCILEVGEIQDPSSLEITVEVNPKTMDCKKWKVYREMGVNRISMGLQSSHDEELKLLGRVHSYDDFCRCFEEARSSGFQNISIDVMSALPNQTLEQYTETLERVCALQPEHISSYSLIIEEGTAFWEQYGPGKSLEQQLPGESLEREMYKKTKTILEEYGYRRYEISNYAKKNFESRHNTSYWIGTSYLGIGLGAASYFDKSRYENTRDLETYITHAANSEKRVVHKEVLTREDQMSEFMFLGLRCMKGISRKTFAQKFGHEVEEVYKNEIASLLEKKLLYCTEAGYALTDYGIDVSNYVFMHFV